LFDDDKIVRRAHPFSNLLDEISEPETEENSHVTIMKTTVPQQRDGLLRGVMMAM